MTGPPVARIPRLRIIDRDIAFYEGAVEIMTANIRNCVPEDEPKFKRLRDRNSDVVAALNALREELDQ